MLVHIYTYVYVLMKMANKEKYIIREKKRYQQADECVPGLDYVNVILSQKIR